MELNDLLGISDFTLVEGSYVEQKWIGKTLEYLSKIKEEDVIEAIRIYDERKELIGIAIQDKDLGFWIIFTDVIADRGFKEDFKARASLIQGVRERTVEIKRKQFHEGVIEFYSFGLVNRLFCECAIKEPSFYPRDRIEALSKVVSDFLKAHEVGKDTQTLEIGCGDGGATIALHEQGIFPLTIDINKCELCKGLEEEVLEPKRSIVMDCSRLSSFFGREFEVVFGFMIGKFTSYDRFDWEKVLREVSKVLESKGSVLFTVSSEEEAHIVHEILNNDFEGDIKENKASDGYFDQWLYVGTLRN
jgi:hypothetical protein